MSHSNQSLHPGIFIKEELEARNWNQRDLAFILGSPEQSITQLITGKRSVTPEMAKALAVAFDVSPELFSNLQQMYDLSIAQEPDIGVEKRKIIQTSYPARDMVKRGWLTETKDPKLLEAQLIRFFDANSLSEVPHIQHAAKKTHYDEIPPAQLAWLFRVRNLAKKIVIPKYSESGLKKFINDRKKHLLDPVEIHKIPEILNKVGVRIVFVEPLPNSKIDGVCFWLDEQSPVIGLSLRYDRIDNFWFCLLHEITHVLRRDGIDNEIIDMEINSEIDTGSREIQEMEHVVNQTTSELIIESEVINQFIKATRPYYSKQKLLSFAEKIKVHPGLLLGRLQNLREIPYTHNRQLLVKIRHYLVDHAIVDGWGTIALL